MSGPWSGYNNVPQNFSFEVEKYADPFGKIAGVGCDGTTSGVDATMPKYSSIFNGGGQGTSKSVDSSYPVFTERDDGKGFVEVDFRKPTDYTDEDVPDLTGNFDDVLADEEYERTKRETEEIMRKLENNEATQMSDEAQQKSDEDDLERMLKEANLTGGGYSFTDEPVKPVAGPGAPYSIISTYDNTKFLRPVFPKEFPSALTGGKKRKTQIGCSRRKTRGGKKTRVSKKMRGGKKTRKIKVRKLGRTRKLRRSHKLRRRQVRHRTMRGGLSSASDYTIGRDASQDIPYGNKALSFIQTFDTTLNANESGLASPTPLLPLNTCAQITRN